MASVLEFQPISLIFDFQEWRPAMERVNIWRNFHRESENKEALRDKGSIDIGLNHKSAMSIKEPEQLPGL